MPDGAKRIRTEAGAWREIARRGAEGFRDRTLNETMTGLCWGADILRVDERRVSRDMFDSMIGRVSRHMALTSEKHGLFNNFYAPLYDWESGRVLAALFLALEAEDEAKAAKKKGRARRG